MSEKDEIDLTDKDFGATTPNIRAPIPARPVDRGSRQSARPPAPPPVVKNNSKRGVPLWIWLTGISVLFILGLVAVAIVYLVWSRDSSFTIVVLDAQPGSAVHVDDVRYGVTAADGTIIVRNLKAGSRRVRVSHEGFKDFDTVVTGRNGERLSVRVSLIPPTTPPATLSTEIEYVGSMILIQAGEFIMGDDNHKAEEKPAHKVTLPDFYIDKFEVTNEQYQKFCKATNRQLPQEPWWDPNYLDKPSMPVLGVSFADATAYAEWAGKRLPTEEEWEKAASWGPAGTQKRTWPWGNTVEPGRTTLKAQSPSVVGSHPAGASAYGVHDMAGNVLEWVNAHYQPYPNNSAPDPNFGTQNRVVRGGSFYSGDEDARTTRRIYAPSQLTGREKKDDSVLVGFRCAVSADDPKLRERLRSQK
ncbi:MAG TPA: SUMF1/EgtB/PvdO family nonheme iron enzyme [Pyrinomonadaceae bacterium]|nr:SUMF1/EgtB/PvdO family nonheme iron enzyme [Pyrinomonadaceae bacterium]